ncbi:MAG: trehalose-phosphatase [Thermoflexales bacterium]|nr:trehalose-phosphatase [Thermoflexales bacterium]
MSSQLDQHPAQAERLWLFLDYDGTLAEFSPTPEHVIPNPQVVNGLLRLSRRPATRIAVISGRRLDHIRSLLPVPGILLAGTYGIELRTPEGEQINRVDYGAVRPGLDVLKPRWEQLIAGCQGFFLEDKGWSLALHARYAADDEARRVLETARRMASESVNWGAFRVLGGHKFLEVGPQLAHKGQTVSYLIDRYPWPGALLVYMGDDDKDEEAFEVIKARGGLTILVSQQVRRTQADYRLESPQAARQWLEGLS